MGLLLHGFYRIMIMNGAVDNLEDLKSGDGTFMIKVLINIFSKSSCFVERVITN